MRRIYYRFPQRVDLSFAMGMPFSEALRHIASLDGSETTKTSGEELVKVRTKVEAAVDRTTFGDVTPDMLRPGAITEAADLRITVHAIALHRGGKVPVANDVFFVRLTDRIKRTDIEVAKDGRPGGLDAMDLKNLILGK
jgi:hypothetical protein